MDLSILIYLYGVLKVFILCFSFHVIYKYVLKPYWLVRFYRTQGGVGFYGFGADYLLKNQEHAVKDKDWYFWYKELLKRNPDIKYFIRNFGSQPLLTLVEPSLVEQFLNSIETYQKDPFVTALFQKLCPGSTLFSNDYNTSHKKRILSLAFQDQFLKKYIGSAITTSLKQFSFWATEELTDFPIIEGFSNIVGENIGRFFFGEQFSNKSFFGVPLAIIVKNWLREVMSTSYSISYFTFGAWFLDLGIFQSHRELKSERNRIFQACEQLLENAPNQPDYKQTILSVINEARSQDPKLYTDQEVIGEFLNLFAISVDSTATLLGMTVYYLSRNPKAMYKVKQEVNNLLQSSEITLDSLNKMEYLTCVLKEALRLSPPIGGLFHRVATKDHYLGQIKIKKDTLVTIYPAILHTSEACYPNASEFYPERWLDPTQANNEKNKQRFACFLPFSTGPRACNAQQLTLMISKLILALFINNFKFSIEKEYDLKMTQRFFYGPLETLECKLSYLNEEKE